MVMRPKSSATVVVILDSTPKVSSTPIPRWLSSSSVCSGRISLIVPTMVVLPTPKPPATRILMAIAGVTAATPGSEPAYSMQHFPVDAFVDRLRRRLRPVDGHKALAPQVTEDHTGDVERELQV